MQIHAYPFPSVVAEKQYFNKTVIVIDVLRATTSMVEALKNGASQLIPARDAGEAMAFAAHLGRRESLLAGESGGLKLNGFDLGNSPLEFTKQAVQGKAVVFCTTNGTGAIYAARSAEHVLLGCMRNRLAAVQKALTYENDILLLCAGTHNECSMDDMVTAGAILRALLAALEEPPQMNDFALACGHLYDDWRAQRLLLASSTHYSHLKKLGFVEDLAFCFEEDVVDVVPQYENGSLRA